jgi:LmbE family N-acetylglucosaminyl deacetylase
MKLTAPIVFALCLTAPAQQAPAPRASAQTTFTDPANLRGERVSPTNGHDLPIDQGPTGLAQLLRKLNTRTSILNIVAHPDDEDGGMLTLYARGLGARVADLSLTRGEGGQNFVTADFEDALGLIRTQELLANDRYTGVTQLFGTEVDFGFSKTKEEAFAKWTHDRVLYDAVRAIRIIRPLVITATFIGNVTDGHGQHQVSGEIAQEAFKAAADPNVFPDQIAEGLLPWQALKVYARVPFAEINSKGVYDYATNQYVPARFTNYVTGKVTTTKPNADVEVPEGTTDPLLAVSAANPSDLPSDVATTANAPFSYAQFARIGLRLQRTQISKNMTLPVSGSYNSGYTLYGSVLCNAPTNARFPLKNSVILSQARSSNNTAILDQARTSNNAVTLSEARSSNNAVILSQARTSNNAVTLSEARSNNNAVTLSEGRSSKNAVILSEARSAQSKDPCILPAAALPPEASSDEQAPTARPITAQGNALGKHTEDAPRAEGPIYNPNLTTQPNFFTGIDTSIEGIATLAPSAPPFLHYQLARLTQEVEAADQAFDPQNPAKVAPSLKDALQTTDALIGLLSIVVMDATQKANALHELRIKRVQLNDALVLALNLHIDSTTQIADIPAATSPHVETRVTELYGDSLAPRALWLENADQLHFTYIANIPGSTRTGGQPPVGQRIFFNNALPSTFTTVVTRPYFVREDTETPVYKLIDPQLRNAPATPPAFTAWSTVDYAGVNLRVGHIVHDGDQPVSIIPAVSIASAPTATVLPNGQTTAQLLATLHTDATTSANINVQSPHNWSIEAKAASPNSVNFYLHPTAPLTGPQLFHITAQTPDHHTYTEGFRPVGYPGLILTNYYTPATTRVVPVDLKLPAHVRIAYLPGTGDAVPQALASIGLAPTMITIADLTPTKLSNYDTVILGVRAYTANPDLHGAPTQSLLDFARNGGNVLVQYQTSDFTASDAPYPLNLGDAEKVVDETAPVQLLAPSSPLLTTPNQITSADFNNWIAERGHGFLDSFAPHYTALTDTHDPGGPVTPAQLPQHGGLITVQLGKGRWTYCAFALYRQLPEAVPGAYRLFVNLLTPTR